jgi:signal transduction histidine kinase
VAAFSQFASPHRVYLAGGLLAIAVYFLLPWDSAGQVGVYDAMGASAAVAVVIGVRLHRPSLPLAWYLFAAGLFSFAVGDAIFNLYALVWERDPPLPSAADAFYLGGYPFLVVGLALLVRRLRAAERRAGLLDAALVTVAFALVQWVFVMEDLVQGGGSAAELTVALSYPAMDVVLLAALAIFFLTPAWRTASYRFLVASVVLLVFADELYGISPSTYAQATWLDSAWLLSYVLWGVAALHPSMTELSTAQPLAARPQLTRLRLGLLAGALAAAPAVLVVQRATGSRVDAIAIAIGAAVLSALVLARLWGLVRALDRLREEEGEARGEAELAQRLLAEQNRRLREADRLKDEFVALISHELRTPLTSIVGYVELMQDESDLTHDQASYLEVVNRNADRLLRLVNDLLFVARLEAGQLDLHLTRLDLAEIVRQSVAEAGPRATAKGVELSCRAEPVPAVAADKGRMFQLLDNLVSNAVKFTPEGGAVHVGVAQVNGVVRLEVTDTGIGIAPEEQRRLFERFFRASSAVDQQIPGTGLGLYIARRIVEAHGGAMEVESAPGEGATFRIDLPPAQAEITPSRQGSAS